MSFLFDRPWNLAPSLWALLSLLCLGLLGTALAYILYYRLLAQIGATRTSLVTYVIPVSGIFWGWLALGERLPWTAFLGLALILVSIASVGEVTRPFSAKAPFDPFGWAAQYVPERMLHRLVRVFMALVCLVFLVRRANQFGDYFLKPLWAVETLVYLTLLVAFAVRTDPRDRSQGLAEIAIPGAGALLPFALLLSAPAASVLRSPVLKSAVFWAMTLATCLTVWGMWALRGSFSITVEARNLVTGGPYRWIRHPVYLGEMGAAAAVALWRFSWLNAGVLLLFVALQLLRSRMEEIKLERNFPGYREYAARAWWLWKNQV